MARRITEASSLLAVLWFLTIPLLAHHSFGAEYDASKPITLTGVVTKVEWTNPHSHFYLDVTDDKGSVTNWKFEGYNPAVLYRIGWKKDTTIKPGDKITVSGWRARDGGSARGASASGATRPHRLSSAASRPHGGTGSGGCCLQAFGAQIPPGHLESTGCFRPHARDHRSAWGADRSEKT